MRTFPIMIIFFVLQGCQEQSVENASNFNSGYMAENAPPELMHWGKIVGQWACTEEAKKANGTDWYFAGSSDWNFMWAFDGWGIQDNYFSPSRSEKLDDETTRQRGTNLRIYNVVKRRWIITWLTTHSRTPDTMTAVSNNDKITMISDGPNARGLLNRVTFYDISSNSFEWRMEQSKDERNWTEMYRIHCKNRA